MIDWDVETFAEVGSTNAEAMSRARAGLVVVAEHQTAGRGRMDRTWETPAGSALTFSAVVPVPTQQASWPLIPLAAGLSVASAIGDAAALKWPNDVLIDDRKVCGVLVELGEPRDQGALAVVGIGVNVAQTADELPVPTATSLALEGIETSRDDLLAGILRELDASLSLLSTAQGDLLTAYRERCATLGRDVRVSLPAEQTLAGRAESIDSSGRLVVATVRGLVSLAAGDVVHVRPAG